MHNFNAFYGARRDFANLRKRERGTLHEPEVGARFKRRNRATKSWSDFEITSFDTFKVWLRPLRTTGHTGATEVNRAAFCAPEWLPVEAGGGAK